MDNKELKLSLFNTMMLYYVDVEDAIKNTKKVMDELFPEPPQYHATYCGQSIKAGDLIRY